MNTTRDTFARAGAVLAATLCLTLTALPAAARTSYVQDGAGMLDQSTIQALNTEIGAFNGQTGKEVVVVTVPSLDGQTLRAAAQKTFGDQQVNGVMIFIAKAERQDLVVGDSASSAFFPSGAFEHIHDAMRGYFREGDFDGGVSAGVGLVLDQYRSHERSGVQTQTQPVTQSQPVSTYRHNVARTGGSSLGHIFWLLLILFAGFLIIRAVFRMFSGPRMYPPAGPGGPPMPGPGYGAGYGPGYGAGYGGGGGGSFFSGLLGGLGGAFLGNELFGNRGGGTVIGGPADAAGGNWGSPATPDASGWQPDPGQADMGNAGGGDWGSGGGFDAGSGGFGDGGGGGFDAGGGGGDGGGW
jgi:uncharacterized membrane protein YgcG